MGLLATPGNSWVRASGTLVHDHQRQHRYMAFQVDRVTGVDARRHVDNPAALSRHGVYRTIDRLRVDGSTVTLGAEITDIDAAARGHHARSASRLRRARL